MSSAPISKPEKRVLKRFLHQKFDYLITRNDLKEKYWRKFPGVVQTYAKKPGCKKL